MLAQFKSKLSDGQRMISVPWAYRRQWEGDSAATQYGNIEVINQWQRETLGDPRYVTVMPFLWQSGVIDPRARRMEREICR